MNFWRSVGGMVRVRLTCADPERMLRIINENHIMLYYLRFSDALTCCFSVRREDLRGLRIVCDKRDVTLDIQSTQGIYWSGKRLIHRPILAYGLLFLTVLVFVIPTRVFFFRVDGNENIPDREILAAAEACGIRFGAARREVRSEKVKNELIASLPQLQWAGINTSGCVATISVKERVQLRNHQNVQTYGNIVAARDGYVLTATASKGTLLVQPGQTVTAGQVLISGQSDLGLLTRITAPEGEVYAQTEREMEAVKLTKWLSHRQTDTQMKKVSVLLGKKRINLWKDSGISSDTCGRMYEEYYVTLPGNFVLPAALCVETFTACDHHLFSSENPEPDGAMENYTDHYLRQQMVAGEIVQAQMSWIQDGNRLVLTKHFVCREMIGRVRREQIGDIYE